MRVTICPPSEHVHNEPRFDKHAFEGRRFLNVETGIDFSNLQHLSCKRVPDLRIGRRLAVPDWAQSDRGLREALLAYLEARFNVRDQSGDAKARLERCRDVARRTAKGTKARLERSVKNYRAVANQNFHEADERIYARLFLASLRGETPVKLLAQVEKQIVILDGETWMMERAPEIVLSALYYYFRLGWDSPSVGEILGIKPPAVRQIVYRASQRAVRKTNGRRRRKSRSAKTSSTER